MFKADTLLHTDSPNKGGQTRKRELQARTLQRCEGLTTGSSIKAGALANRDKREALRGAEEQIFDLLAEILTTNRWSELLRAPLEHAAAKGNVGLVQKLVRAGAKIGDALHTAARGGHGDIVSDLLENGASTEAQDSVHGYTPLHLASREGKTEMVQLLLAKGADKDALDYFQRTPLCVAAWKGHEFTALVLMAAGADVNLRYGRHEKSVVHVAAEGGRVDIMRTAIRRGADVDAVDTDNKAPLHAAALYDKVEAISVLLEEGANTEARDFENCTPLHDAAAEASPEAVSALLKHGAHINAQDDDHNTPLHWVACFAGLQGATEIVDLLLRSGADETILNGEGKTAADVVAEGVEEQYQVADDVKRVRQLLANAPADRAWRRRGYLVLCRAHPDRMKKLPASGSACVGVARITSGSAKLARTETGSCIGTAGGSTVDDSVGRDWAVVVARVLGLQEEVLFQTIVEYL